MYAVMGITGQVGGAIAQELLDTGQQVRGIVRDASKATRWQQRGAELAVADSMDAHGLQSAFEGMEAVFVMIPPNFAPDPHFSQTRAIVVALKAALQAATPDKIVVLSSVGAQHDCGLGLIAQLHMLEEALSEIAPACAFLRPAWFMDNAQWDIGPARDSGELTTFLESERAIPMISTVDIGRIATRTLQEQWNGRRILEIEGPASYSPNDEAALLSQLLGRPIEVKAVPRSRWQSVFEAQGTPANRTAQRIEMLDGFNSGWIAFEENNTEHIRGSITLEATLRRFIAG